ncbi:MAG TPA: hypothetical protein PL182_08685, partial [Pseudobdellovibrionaceae bacterium]|nr:hypothetical protein [Pseudobdellovibrionaceae bacterium]
ENPQALLKYLENGDFSSCGAAVSENAAEAICKAALVAHEKRSSSSRLVEVPSDEAAPTLQ